MNAQCNADYTKIIHYALKHVLLNVSWHYTLIIQNLKYNLNLQYKLWLFLLTKTKQIKNNSVNWNKAEIKYYINI